jgi:hypothetical protein
MRTTHYVTHTYLTPTRTGARRFRTEAAAIRAADRARLGAWVVQVTRKGGWTSHGINYRTGLAAA